MVRRAARIDWLALSDPWSPRFISTTGRPALPTRLMASLLYLKLFYATSDDDVVERWRENPYWKHFSGERYFRHEWLHELSWLASKGHWRIRSMPHAMPV
jgi:transposase, IS5 family